MSRFLHCNTVILRKRRKNPKKRDLLSHRVCLTDDDVTLTLGDPEEIDFGDFFGQRVRYLSEK